ncbi:MAG: helix-turn-helix domain-containing protein [Kofleriaceae bacterium]
MMSATSFREFGVSTLKTTIFLERQFRAHLVYRDRLLYDTAFAPPAKKAQPFVHLYATLKGFIAVDGGPAHEAPHVYVLAETEFDRMEKGSPTLRSWGNPGVIVELRVPAQYVRVPIGIKNGPLQLGDAVWAAYQRLESEGSEGALYHVLVELVSAGVLAKDLTASVVTEEPERFKRLWTVLKPLYEDQATSASLKQIAIVAKLSLRQLGRDLGDVTRTFGLFGAGFRDAMRVLRLRAAVLMLSAPGSTPSDVARIVGYGSLDAMGRAFRDAALPAPSVVQAAVKYPET